MRRGTVPTHLEVVAKIEDRNRVLQVMMITLVVEKTIVLAIFKESEKAVESRSNRFEIRADECQVVWTDSETSEL